MSNYTYIDIQVTFINAADRYTRNADKSNDTITIEQIKYKEPKYKDFGSWLEETYGGTADYSNWESMSYFYELYSSAMCDENGTLPLEFKVFKSRRDLEYTIFTSRGEFENEEPIVKTEQIKDDLNISAETSRTFTGEVTLSIDCAEWAGPVFDENRNRKLITPPITVVTAEDGNGNTTYTLDFGGEVCSGTIHCARTIEYDYYVVNVEPRTNGDEVVNDGGDTPKACGEHYEAGNFSSAYGAYITASWEKDYTIKEMEIPEKLGDTCLGGGSVIIDPDEDDEDKEKCVRKVELWDRCKDEKLDEWYEDIVCPEDEEPVAETEEGEGNG